MTPEQRQLLRRAMLITLADASASIGLPLRGSLGLNDVIVLARPDLKTALDEGNSLAKEVLYLEYHSLLEEVGKQLDPEIKHYRITLEGRDYLAKLGLA